MKWIIIDIVVISETLKDGVGGLDLALYVKDKVHGMPQHWLQKSVALADGLPTT